LFENENCMFKDGDGEDIFKGKMKGKRFPLNPLEEEQIVFQMKKNVTDLWYKRLDNYLHHGLLQLKSKEIANDLSEFGDHISESILLKH